MSRTPRRVFAIACVIAAAQRLPAQQEVPPEKQKVAEAVRADLTKLTGLEREFFSANKRFTVDTKALHFVPASGATIAVTYASARTFSASASDYRLVPFLCFVIASSSDPNSPAEKPFCTDSRYGTAAIALAKSGAELSPQPAQASSASPSIPSQQSVTPVTKSPDENPLKKSVDSTASQIVLTPFEFEDRLRAAANAKSDSIIVIVQFAVKDARYDPSRGVLEVSVDRVPLPLASPLTPENGLQRLALACFTRPAFVCGLSGLTYIARDLLRVPVSRAPDPAALRSGLTLQARFAVGRRDDSPGPALSLLALVLRSNGAVISRWDGSGIR
jgi:hypothetical protein